MLLSHLRRPSSNLRADDNRFRESPSGRRSWIPDFIVGWGPDHGKVYGSDCLIFSGGIVSFIVYRCICQYRIDKSKK